MDEIKFEEFPKIPRLTRNMVISEKVDGTNGTVYIADDFETVLIGSRTRWITPQDDNAGFANWVTKYKADLIKLLGPGMHRGEWWGQGIQRTYGMKKKIFSLFNTSLWSHFPTDGNEDSLLHCVPTLAAGLFDTNLINIALEDLQVNGSKAAPSFMNAEGIVIYHTAANVYFKKTILKDDEYKGLK